MPSDPQQPAEIPRGRHATGSPQGPGACRGRSRAAIASLFLFGAQVIDLRCPV